jgi:hypothetical protein
MWSALEWLSDYAYNRRLRFTPYIQDENVRNGDGKS